jgi:hypothetical protein
VKSKNSISKKIISLINEASDTDRISDLSRLLGANYSSFVSQLKGGISDHKTQAALMSGLEDGQLKDDVMAVRNTSFSVKKLIPTQHEVDMTKSLFYPLTDVGTANKCLSGKNVSIQGPIITFRGRYIIDGHHRWSQVYAINSNATILATDLSLGTTNPIIVLKAVQMAIAAHIKNLPIENVEGTNLFSVSRVALNSYVLATIKPNIASMFKTYESIGTPQEISNYIWNNILYMRSTSTPISGAPGRNYMPQTGDAPGWTGALERGQINWNNPL